MASVNRNRFFTFSWLESLLRRINTFRQIWIIKVLGRLGIINLFVKFLKTLADSNVSPQLSKRDGFGGID